MPKKRANQPLPSPKIRYKANAEDGLIIFYWEPVEGANEYEVEVCEKGEFGTPPFEFRLDNSKRTSLLNYLAPGDIAEGFAFKLDVPRHIDTAQEHYTTYARVKAHVRYENRPSEWAICMGSTKKSAEQEAWEKKCREESEAAWQAEEKEQQKAKEKRRAKLRKRSKKIAWPETVKPDDFEDLEWDNDGCEFIFRAQHSTLNSTILSIHDVFNPARSNFLCLEGSEYEDDVRSPLYRFDTEKALWVLTDEWSDMFEDVS